MASMIDPPPGPVPARDLGRQRGQRQQGVHELRVRLAPEPGVHPAHRGAHHQPQVIDLQPLGHQPVLGLDHVPVAVAGEAGAEPVAGLARPAVPDAVGEDEVVAGRVERLALAEELARELGPEEIGPAAGRPVQDEHGVADLAVLAPVRRAERAVMDAELGQRLARRRTGSRG